METLSYIATYAVGVVTGIVVMALIQARAWATVREVTQSTKRILGK